MSAWAGGSSAQVLLVASAAIILALGILHLVYTFIGRKLHPRDPELQARMREVQLVITRETTVWKAWIGFNASHSAGAILFGVIYGYLALAHTAFLFESRFLCALGALFLAGYLALGRLYWFSVPYRSILVATVCYVGAVMLAWA
jgi:hypothetical protein